MLFYIQKNKTEYIKTLKLHRNLILPILSLILFISACREISPSSPVKNKDAIDTISIIQSDTINSGDQYISDSAIVIYLTFDDGPYYTTSNLTSFLDSKQIKSSFFIVGSQVKYSTEFDSVFRAVKSNPLFRVYNHTYSHAITHGRVHQYYRYPENVWADIERNKQILQVSNSITRLPGMNTWRVHKKNIRETEETVSLLAYLSEQGKDEQIIGWDFEWKEKQSKSKRMVDTLLVQIKRSMFQDGKGKKDIVILAHDYLFRSEQSIENLNYFIDELQKEKQVEFRWVEDLLARSDESK